jgi:hypothetical protein
MEHITAIQMCIVGVDPKEAKIKLVVRGTKRMNKLVKKASVTNV